MEHQSNQRDLEPALEEIRGLLQKVDPSLYPQLISCLQGHIQLIEMAELSDGSSFDAYPKSID